MQRVGGGRAVVQRCRGKCPDSAGGGGGGEGSLAYIRHHIQSLCVFSDPPTPTVSPSHFVLQEPSNAHGHVWGILRRHRDTETRVSWSERARPQTRGASDLHFHSEKGLESFPPSRRPLWGSQAGYSYLGYQVSSGGVEKGFKGQTNHTDLQTLKQEAVLTLGRLSMSPDPKIQDMYESCMNAYLMNESLELC